jgi:hypothetical protein
MADYININGNNIPIRASDPSNPILGEIWYNSTTNALKGQGFDSGSWSTTPNKNNNNFYFMSGGTATSAVKAGGRVDGPQLSGSQVEEYDGSSWTTQTSLPTAQDSGSGNGPSGSFLFGGSNNSSTTFLYDGAWTTGPSVNTGSPNRYYTSFGAGQTSSVVAGGEGPGGTVRNRTEEWNGSSWTSVTNMPTAAESPNGWGVESSGVALGGGPTPVVGNKTQEYDGTTWSLGTNAPASSSAFGVAGESQTAGLVWGGNLSPNQTTLLYDGTSYTTSPATIPTGGSNNAKGYIGSQSAAIAADQPPISSFASFEFTKGATTVTFSGS